MNKYEAMFILRPDLSDEEKKVLFSQLGDSVVKNKGALSQASIWSERKKLYFPMKKYREGIYYLMNFDIAPSAIAEMRRAYNINENILRVLITRVN